MQFMFVVLMNILQRLKIAQLNYAVLKSKHKTKTVLSVKEHVRSQSQRGFDFIKGHLTSCAECENDVFFFNYIIKCP